jgi:hypothetical protein
MALFTDAAIVTLDDLVAYEGSLVQVASSHGINVETKIGLATSGIGDRLMQWLLSAGAADPQWLNRRQIGLSTVVVTPPVRRWLCFESLARIFAEAYNTQLNTRFQGKWNECKAEARQAMDLCRLSGIGIVRQPLPKPQTPLVSAESGTAPAQEVFVQTAWTDMAGQESALSTVNGLVLGDGSSIVVAMAEGALGIPDAAFGWNVYAGSSLSDLTRQNTTPLAIGSTWELPDSGFIEGVKANDGQAPDHYVSLPRQVQRG